jgi:hypothetical protein
MHPASPLTRRGATPRQAWATIGGSIAVVVATAWLLYVGTHIAIAAVILIAIFAPQVVLLVVGQWSQPPTRTIEDVFREWPAVHPPPKKSPAGSSGATRHDRHGY